MLMLRFAAMLTVAAVAAGVLAYMFTGERKYLRLSGRIARYALYLALLVLGLMFIERLLPL